MMKKLWDLYSYSIILLVLSLLTALIIFFRTGVSSNEEFMTITVSEGDTLWEIAEVLSAQHSLTSKEFVKWVEKNNAIYGDRIFPGDELVIPVTINNSEMKEYASLNFK